MALLIYEDKPKYDTATKLTIIIIPTFCLFIAFQYPEPQLFAIAVVVLAVFWIIFPRRYQIFEDKLRVVLGKPFSFNIPFEAIKSAGAPQKIGFGMNWATSMTKRGVEITRKKRMNVFITPSDGDSFIENLNGALADWRKFHAEYKS